jgi:hypothetical protein
MNPGITKDAQGAVRRNPEGMGADMTVPEIHDLAFGNELKAARLAFANMSRKDLLELQRCWRSRYASEGPTHQATARCMALAELLQKKVSA